MSSQPMPASPPPGEELPAPPLPAEGEPIALFIEIDGTLVDFAMRADHASLQPSTLALLARLSVRLGGALAVLSGRSLDDVDRLLQPLQLPAGALHGLQCRDASGRVTLDAPPRNVAGIVGEACNVGVAPMPGVWVEDKAGFGFAMHFRGARQYAARVQALAESVAAASSGHYTVQRGDCVAELKPAGSDKGAAMLALLSSPPFRRRRPFMLGDDLTDESAFAMAERLGGVAIIVGSRRPTRAHFALPSPNAVIAWLSALAVHLDSGGMRS